MNTLRLDRRNVITGCLVASTVLGVAACSAAKPVATTTVQMANLGKTHDIVKTFENGSVKVSATDNHNIMKVSWFSFSCDGTALDARNTVTEETKVYDKPPVDTICANRVISPSEIASIMTSPYITAPGLLVPADTAATK